MARARRSRRLEAIKIRLGSFGFASGYKQAPLSRVFSRWWPDDSDSLIIVQPETVLRWRRIGWSALCR